VGFTILLSIFGASGLIANDLRTGAILVYLSRPLTRRDYVLGKLCVPLALNLAVTLVPALGLYLVALGLAPDQFLKWDLAWIGPAIVAHAVGMSLFVSLLALAVSSLSRSARVAGHAVGNALFGLADPDLAVHWAGPVVVLVLVALGCLAILKSRVRAVEIVT
jgi:ABC-type transport system involved in multi-copper enzyme maturation permease subunit